MQERNEFLEGDGLYFESETHEWFKDKIATDHAHRESALWGSTQQNDALTNLRCFVVRDKKSGDYKRVVMDSDSNQVIYQTDSLEALAFFLDKLKILKRFS